VVVGLAGLELAGVVVKRPDCNAEAVLTAE